MRRSLLDGESEAAAGAPSPAAAAAAGSSFPSPAASPLTPPSSSAAGMGMAVSRSVLYIGIGMAALVWLVALVVIVRTCMRQRRQAGGSSGSQNTDAAAAADKPRKRVFAAPLPVLIIQPDHASNRRSLDLGYEEEQRWGSWAPHPCPASQDGKMPGRAGSAAGGGQFMVELAEAGVWLPDDDGGSRSAGAAGSPGGGLQGSRQG